MSDPIAERRRAQITQRVLRLSDDARNALRARLGMQLPPLQRASASRASRASQSAKLVAFVVIDRTLLDESALRTFLGTRLPEHMVPARFVARDNLPRTAAGKLDRKALQQAALPENDVPKRVDAPRSNVETMLARIWKDVLRLDEISIHDNFFEIGGDSLLSIRVIARAAKEGIKLRTEQFFENPTIAHIAAVLAAPAVPVQPVQTPGFISATIDASVLATVSDLLSEIDES